MRVLRNGELVGILVSPGEELITDDPSLVGVLETVGHLGEVRVQTVINALNQAGYEARGAYQTAEQAQAREKDLMLFHTGIHHSVGVRMTVKEDFEPAKAPPKTHERVVPERVGVADPEPKKKGGLLSWLE